MRYFLYILVIIVLLGLNFGMFTYLPFFGMHDLLLLFLLVLVTNNEEGYYFFAVLAGVYMDFTVNAFPGTYLLAYILLVFLIRLIFDKVIFNQNPIGYLLLSVSSVTIVLPFWVYLYNQVFYWLKIGGAIGLGFPTLKEIFIRLICNLILLFPIYFLENNVNNIITKLRHSRRLL